MTKKFDDVGSMALLFVLYTLQGIPMGLSGSVPLLLAKRVTYADQAVLSFCSWPFSLKLLWAPIVDSIYVPSFGRRKSWLVPVQLLCGLMMVGVAPWMNNWVGDGDGDGIPDGRTEVEIYPLATYFLMLYFLMATQDIAVDGWALTMLSPENVGYASTCNSVGQTLGYFIAFIGFLTLNDPETCNKYLRSAEARDEHRGMVTLASFIKFWGWVFVFTTLYVWVFKPEKVEKVDEDAPSSSSPSSPSSSFLASLPPPPPPPPSPLPSSTSSSAEEGDSGAAELGGASGRQQQPHRPADSAVAATVVARLLGSSTKNGTSSSLSSSSSSSKYGPTPGGDWQTVLDTYRQLWRVLQLPAVRLLSLILLTCKMGFAVTDAATTLK